MTKPGRCKVIAISSMKGGVGKTTTTANLGAAISKIYGKRVLVVDANLSVPNLGIHFGYIDIENTIHDALENDIEVHEAVYEHQQNLHVLPGLVKGKFSNRWSLLKIISKLKSYYDIILIDTSPSYKELSKTFPIADEIVFIATPDYPTLSSTLQLIEYAKRKIPVKGIILNMVKNKSFELKESDINEATDVNLLGSIPYNIKIQKAVANFSPLCLNSSMNNVFRSYKKIIPKLLNEEIPRQKLIEFLKSI